MAIFNAAGSKWSAWLRQNSLAQAFQNKVWPPLEKFLIAGPTFIGFVLGIWRHAPESKHFEVALQSLLIFAAYLAALTVFQTIDTLFLDAWPIILASTRSLLALLYLLLTLKQFFEWRSDKVQIYAITQKLRERLKLA